LVSSFLWLMKSKYPFMYGEVWPNLNIIPACRT
jgi:hypothetical protein